MAENRFKLVAETVCFTLVLGGLPILGFKTDFENRKPLLTFCFHTS